MPSNRIKEILKLSTIPLVLMGIYLSMIFLWKLFSFPPPEELVIIVSSYFEKYGLLIVFIAALIEGVLLIGQYFPGGFIIFLGVISAAGNVLRAVNVILVVSLAFLISYYVNYLIGKYGWYKLFSKFGLKQSIDNSKKRLLKHGLKAVLFSYWEPNLASITATAAGILQLSARKFILYSMFGILIWSTFWGVLIFNIGEAALKLTGVKYITLIFLIWITIIIIGYFIREKRKVLKKKIIKN